ncbi:MAG: transcriptional regulator [Alphaproteobacteria bacterium]|nr:MAG: transcriptional regulator [Alphaproteobacteria bacterium]
MPSPPRSSCPINFGLEIFGDQWTLLVLRDLLIQQKRTFREFQASDERIASNILAERLKRLEACGLITRAASPADGRVMIYSPTDAARDLIPVLVEMSYWGATHDPATGAPEAFKAAYRTDRAGLIAAIRAGKDPSRDR